MDSPVVPIAPRSPERFRDFMASRIGKTGQDRVRQGLLGPRHLTQYARLLQEIIERAIAPARAA